MAKNKANLPGMERFGAAIVQSVLAAVRAEEHRAGDEVGKRQQRWHQIAFEQRSPLRIQVAERAVTRYGLILDEMNNR